MLLIALKYLNYRITRIQKKLLKCRIKLPDIAFDEETPNFTVDLLKLSDQILKNYDFIPTTQSSNKTSIMSAGFNH